MSETVTVMLEASTVTTEVTTEPSAQKKPISPRRNGIFSDNRKIRASAPWPTPPGGGKTVVEFGDDHRKKGKEKSRCCGFRR